MNTVDKINLILKKTNISKVNLAKYLGVSRQMVYNYLDSDDLNKMPAEKCQLLFNLLEVRSCEDIVNKELNDEYLQSVSNMKEAKYILGYVAKNNGYLKYNVYDFNEENQFIFESIMYSAMTLYTNGGASKSKLAESHRRWEADLERKNEEKLSRTQELNTAKVQALRELGYTEINERNASEVFDKIAEIQARNNKY